MDVANSSLGVWFPTIKAGTGTDIYTINLFEGLEKLGINAQITWLPHYCELLPWIYKKSPRPGRANIIHINSWLHPRFIQNQLPVICTIHHSVHDPEFNNYKTFLQKIYHNYWIKPIENKNLSSSTLNIAVSNYTAESAKKIFGINKIEVIHNGINIDGLFNAKGRSLPHGPFRLFFIGSWTRRKGVDLLAPIMKELGSQYLLYFTISERELKKIKKLPSNMIPLLKPFATNQIVEFYKNFDALLFPSRLEGFGLVALEAQACGLPVICTDGSGLREVVKDHKTGYLCQKDNVDDFVDKILKLSNDMKLWKEMSSNGRRWVSEKFTLDRMVKRYVEEYLKAVNEV